MRTELWPALGFVTLMVCSPRGPDLRHAGACEGAPDTAEVFAASLSVSGRVFRGVLGGADGRTLYFFKR
jgi:hypothetical protein